MRDKISRTLDYLYGADLTVQLARLEYLAMVKARQEAEARLRELTVEAEVHGNEVDG